MPPANSFVNARDCLRRPHACVNGLRGHEIVYLILGNRLTQTTTATVLTDSNCAPDTNEISHCLNTPKLANGKRITVRHDHNMANDPCLTPGEHVLLSRL
jgi:hypothetical protein